MVTATSMVTAGVLLALVSWGCGSDPQAEAGAGVGGGGGERPSASSTSSGGDGGGGVAVGAGGDGGAAPEPPACGEPGSQFVSQVVEVSFGPGQSFGRAGLPEVVYGPPHGGGCCMGSLDVVSLGNGGSIVVGFGDTVIVDEPGVDFVVFENPFETDGGVFAELATVAVSADGIEWVEFPCDAVAPPYGSCAGHQPVYLDGELGPIDVSTAGGDGFDLADVGLSMARYVRITDRSDLDGDDGVFDLDAVGIVNPTCDR